MPIGCLKPVLTIFFGREKIFLIGIPLVSGDTNTVHEANVSVKEKTIAEFEVDENEWEDYLWDEEA